MSIMNEFLPFAEAENANLIPFSEWQNAAARLSGFSSGIARSNQINRAIAQGANISYAIAKFIERTLKEDVYVSQPDLLVDQFYRALLEMSYRTTPIGCILTFPVQVEIEGFVVSNFGGDLSRIDYDKLFAVYGTKFNVSSTPETKFGIPNLAHNFLEAAGHLAEIGCFVKAGLPNISGAGVEYMELSNFATPEGAFRKANWNSYYDIESSIRGQEGGFRETSLTFSAGWSNDIYKDSISTVQPSAIRALTLIRSY